MRVQQPNQTESTHKNDLKVLLNNELLQLFHANKDDPIVKKFFRDLRALSKPPKEPKEPKPKKTLSPERLEAMRQGRERKKAQKIFHASE